MAEQEPTLSAEEALEEAVADFTLGPEQPEEEYEPNPEPVAEGEDGVDEDAEEVKAEEPEESEVPETVEIEFDGTLYEVPVELQDAFMKNADYTQKTQAVAQQRNEYETLYGSLVELQKNFEFAESTQDDVLKIQQLHAAEEQAHQYMKENLQNLSSTEIEQIRFAIEDNRKEREGLTQGIQQKQAEFQQAREQAHAELLNKGTEILRQRIPGWGEEHQTKVRDYALSSGFSEAEVSGVTDPRQVEVLWKAAQYDALKDGAVPAVKKVQAAPEIKPKARNPMPEDVKNKLNLRKKLKSGKLSNAEKAQAIGDSIGII